MSKYRKKLRFLALLLGISLSSFGIALGQDITGFNIATHRVKQSKTTRTTFNFDYLYVLTANTATDGCIIGNTEILAIKDNVAGTTVVNVSVYEVDSCNFGQIMEQAQGQITIPNKQMTVDPLFNRETLRADGMIFDSISDQNQPVSFDLVWIGSGDIIYETVTDDLRKGTFHKHILDTHDTRLSTTTGTVTGLNDWNNTVFFFPNSVQQHEEGRLVVRP